MEKDSFYTPNELEGLGLGKYGNNVFISRKASFYEIEKISLGSHVRIDDYCILSGKIWIGSYVHIAAYAALFGKKGIDIHDFSGLSPRVIILSESDDFSGKFLTGPEIPKEFTNVKGGKVILNKYVVIGAGSIVLPNVTIGEGAAIGAMSLVNKNIDNWTINVGIPTKIIKERSKELLNKANFLLL